MEIAGIPLFTFVGFVLTIASFVFDIIGFAAPYWWKFESSHGGIWRYCSSSICVDYADVPSLPCKFYVEIDSET